MVRSPIWYVEPKPSTHSVTRAMPPTDNTAEAMKPLYSAPMMLVPPPRRTKKVPAIDATMQTPPMASGNDIIGIIASEPTKKIDARTMVATTVTA